MNFRRITGLFGGATAGALVLGDIAQAQEELGDSIASSVASAVSSIDTNSSSTANGGTSVESSEVLLGVRQGLAIADASGGSYNTSLPNG